MKGHQFVVLAHGASPYLSQCLASVLGQTAASSIVIATSTPCEHISEVGARYSATIRVNPDRRGIAADWNFGLSCATEGLVTLAHQDDIYYPDFTSETRRLFESAPHASLCFTEYDEIDSKGHRLRGGRVLAIKRILRLFAIGRSEVINSRSQRRRLVAFGNVIPCPSVSLNRDAAPDFRFSEEFTINLDWEGWWRLHELDLPFLASPHALMAHRLHEDAETSRSKSDGRRRAEDRVMFNRIWPAAVANVLSTIYRLGY